MPDPQQLHVAPTTSGMFNTRVLFQDAVLDNASYAVSIAGQGSGGGATTSAGLSGSAAMGGAASGKRNDASNFDTVSLRSQDVDTIRSGQLWRCLYTRLNLPSYLSVASSQYSTNYN